MNSTSLEENVNEEMDEQQMAIGIGYPNSSDLEADNEQSGLLAHKVESASNIDRFMYQMGKDCLDNLTIRFSQR